MSLEEVNSGLIIPSFTLGYENIRVWESCTIGDIFCGLDSKITYSHFQPSITFFLVKVFLRKKMPKWGKNAFLGLKWGKNSFWVNGVNPKSLVAPLVQSCSVLL